MSIKYFCDGCGGEIVGHENAVGHRIKGTTCIGNATVRIEVMAGAGTAINAGQLCVPCVVRAVGKVAA